MMADADLDVIIRQLAKQQNKSLLAAAKSRRDRYIGLAAKAKDAETKHRYKEMAKNTMEQDLPPPSGCRFPPTTPRTVMPGRSERAAEAPPPAKKPVAPSADKPAKKTAKKTAKPPAKKAAKKTKA